jgi:CRISPR-associated protein Cas1
MPMAYVTIPGAAVKLRGESLIVEADDREVAAIELTHLEGLVAVGRVAITSPALHALLERVIPVAMMTASGRLRGRLVPSAAASVDARLGQFAVLACEALRLAAARRVVRRKLEAMDACIGRWLSNHPDARLRATRSQLQRHAESVQAASTPEGLLGVEGSAARLYWSGFALMNGSDLPFGGRLSRPPGDAVNAMLSLGYTLLANEIAGVLDAAGLDPCIGYYHVPKPGRPSLALDVMEPFRHAVIDRAVLAAINLRRFRPADFSPPEKTETGWRLSAEALKRFLEVYEEAMLTKAEASMLDAPDGSPPPRQAAVSCRDAMRRKCERLSTWFREAARSDPVVGRWSHGPVPRLAA